MGQITTGVTRLSLCLAKVRGVPRQFLLLAFLPTGAFARSAAFALCLLVGVVGGLSSPVLAQGLAAGWDTNLDATTGQKPGQSAPNPNTTVVPRSNSPAVPQGQSDVAVGQGAGSVRLVALLFEGSQKIDRGLVWRIFEHGVDSRAQPKLLSTVNKARPLVRLKPGKYAVNVAFGRAYLTRIIDVRAGGTSSETFVLHAGGLKLLALVDGKKAAKNTVQYDILEGEPDQLGERKTVIANIRPGTIIRLNAGIYRINSRYGDANAMVSADVQVEAGKLSVATISHAAAKVTFKLVEKAGGEALPGIQWLIATPEGDVVKQSVGALPTHILAPGTYTVTANSTLGTFRAEFAIKDGQLASVEVVMN